jgi:hypothetical protein
MGKRSKTAWHGVGTMARRSGSKPKMSWKPISLGKPRLRRW